MALAEKIRTDMQQALRQRDALRCSVLRLTLSSIHNAEIDQQKKIDDTGVITVLEKAAKMLRESIEAFEKGNRQDLVDKETAELAIIMEYLPKQMSREEIVEAAKKVISEVGAKGPGDKGKVMSQLMPQLKGKAQGQEISNVVAELLSST